MEKEEGEMSDDDSMMSVDSDVQQVNTKHIPEKNDKLRLEKTDATKLEERAKRFGLDLTGKRAITDKQIDELYHNCNIKDGNERHYRFDTLHLSGIDGLTTREIFSYLEDYKPVSLEWIDRNSCNIVCQDHIAAALAMLAHSREIKDVDTKKMVLESSNHHWREGYPHPKNDFIMFRFATNSDKKNSKMHKEKLLNRIGVNSQAATSSKNPWGDLCQSWGVHDHQEVFNRPLYLHSSEEDEEKQEETVTIKNVRLANRLGKRQHKVHVSDSDHSDSDYEWKTKSKVPRMRMRADDEEESSQKKTTSLQNNCDDNEFAPLSIEIINESISHTSKPPTILSEKFKFPKSSITSKDSLSSRLGRPKPPQEHLSDDDNDDSSASSDNTEYSTLQKMSSTVARKSSNVWSRLDSANLEENQQNDLRRKLKLKNVNGNDLRKRLGNNNTNKSRSPLRIEIDNDYYDDDDDL